MSTLNKSFDRIGRILHILSFAKFGFYLAGTGYMVRTFTADDPAVFADRLSFTLLLYGFAMSLEGLRNNTAVPEKLRASYRKRARRWATYLLVSIFMFAWVPLFGLYMLFYIKDVQQGVAIIAFGIGGLCLMRQEYERFHLVLQDRLSSSVH